MSIRTLSTPAFYGYMAGKMNCFRREFMRRARDDSAGRAQWIKIARQYNRDFIHYIRLARKFES
jgi:hypothetical protein